MRCRAGWLLFILVVSGCGPSVDVDEPTTQISGTASSSSESSASTSSGAGGAGGTTSSSGIGGSGAACAGVPVDEAIGAFGDCMALSDWTANGLDQLANTSSLQNGPCWMCHSDGLAGIKLSDPSSAAGVADTFAASRFPPQINYLVEGVGDPACTTELAPSNGWAEYGQPPHPAYQLSPEVTQGLQTFFDITYAKWQMGPCMPEP